MFDKMIEEEKNEDSLSKREVIDESMDEEEEHENEDEESEGEEWMDRIGENKNEGRLCARDSNNTFEDRSVIGDTRTG